jgi:hypothetical protein
MLLRHATPARNVNGILQRGILCRKSQGRLKVVWLHSPSRSHWALLHTVGRHGGRVERVVILEIDVPRTWLRRSKAGLWYCVRDVPPARIRGAVTFGKLAGAPGGRRRVQVQEVLLHEFPLLVAQGHTHRPPASLDSSEYGFTGLSVPAVPQRSRQPRPPR